ncbi:MAG: carbon-nitrogen hydrolase, partial [Deltaproteobacteria bacterium CG_4_10_14_0_2_um_filter_43_8]
GGAQIVVHPAAFPRERIDQLEVCLRARAIENQFFAVMANNCGTIGGAEFGGRSMMVGPAGDIKAKASETEEAVITATLDLSEMDLLRKEKPVLSKKRPELY